MERDARTIASETRLEADFCIIGAGPAGITLARELAELRRSVILLESGGAEADGELQALNDGVVIRVPVSRSPRDTTPAGWRRGSSVEHVLRGPHGSQIRSARSDRLRAACGNPAQRLAIRPDPSRALLPACAYRVRIGRVRRRRDSLGEPRASVPADT